MNEGVTFVEVNYDKAWIDNELLKLNGFLWLYEWGMYLFVLLTLAILIWIFFDSITKHKDQQALVPRILSMIGFFLIIPAYIFRFTGNANGVSTKVRLAAEPGTPYYPGPINWNVNWLVNGYGTMIAIIALTGVLLSIVAMVIYASMVHRAKPSTTFVNAFDAKIANLERKVDDVQHQSVSAPSAPSAPFVSGPMSTGSAPTVGSMGTILDRKPQSATIIDLPKTGDSLIVKSGSGNGTVYDLPANDVIIGRDSNSFIVLSDGKVSSRHLKLVYDGRGWSVLDLGSTNGTYLNGAKINGQVALSDGATIKIGDTILEFHAGR